MSVVRPDVQPPFAPLRPWGGAARATIVFDLDGTLVDTAPDLAAGLNHCLKRAGHAPVPVETVRPHAGKGVRSMLEFAFGALGLTLAPEEMEAHAASFLGYYERHIADHSTLFPGALAAMERLAAAGHTLAICTNKTERLARILIAELGLLDRFAAICGADTFARRKPDPMHLLGTIERAGGTPPAAVMIGDTAADIDAARASGIPSILVDFGYGADEATRARATRIVGSFHEIDAVFVDGMLAGHALAC